MFDLALNAALLSLLLVIGVPVPACFGAAVIMLVLMGNYPTSTFLIPSGLSKASSVILMAIPLFIYAGNIISAGGIGDRLVVFIEAVVGRIRGGLGVVVILVTAVFGAISGMATSAVATIGGIMIPKLIERGYSPGYACSLVAASAVLALLIPPSATMILYGWVTATSISAVFLAPVLPACLLIALLSFWNFVLTSRMAIVLPAPQSFTVRRRVVIRTGIAAAPGLLMPVVILWVIYGGIATPVEAAAIAVVYAIPVSVLVYRGLDFRAWTRVSWRSAQTSGVLMMVVFFSSMLAMLWALENYPMILRDHVLSLSDDPIIVLLLINLLLIVVGMFMDDVAGILLVVPMLFPVVTEIGIHPVHFGAIIAVNLGMGLITPPTAPILYFASLVGGAPFSSMVKPTLVFIFLAYLPVVLATSFIPALSMTLPRLLLGIE
jgi:C4-dicarboxylate transporter, DctM subunit